MLEGKPANLVRFTGVGLKDNVRDGAVAVGHFRGQTATQYSYTNEEVVVEFKNGVPLTVTDDNEVPHLHFVITTADYEIVALQETDFEFAKPSTITINKAEGIECSFAGGCEYTIISEGLTSALMNNENSIQVCGNTCIFEESLSDGGQATCILPPLATPYSVDEFSIVKSEVLDSDWTGSGSDNELAKLSDGEPTKKYHDNGDTCWFEFGRSKSEHVYSIDEVGFYLPDLDKTRHYIGKLVIKGLNGHGAWENIWAIDSSIHKGWNRK